MTRLIQQLSVIVMVILAFVGMNCPAATHYVVTNGTPGVTSIDPYTSWATAGTNIIDVVNAALTNDAPRVVWVTNGTYYPTNQIAFINKSVTLNKDLYIQSVNGYTNTILNGANAGDNRCILIDPRTAAYSGDFLFQGFTVTNYHCPNFVDGTLNVMYAKIFHWRPTGTPRL